jgi:hypothetical protein
MSILIQRRKERAAVGLAAIVSLTVALVAISAIVGVAQYVTTNSESSASLCPYAIPTLTGSSSSSSSYGYTVTFCVKTGPSPHQPLPLGHTPFYLYLQSIFTAGTCNLTGALGNGGALISGSSGECSIIANVTGSVVNATSGKTLVSGPSFCEADNIALGAAPSHASPLQDPLPVAWAATGPNGSDLVQYYKVAAANNTGDFRIGWSSLQTPSGSNTFLCSAYLFDGYSADLYVPAHVGLFNFTGTQGAFGTFLYYYSNVTPLFSSHGSPVVTYRYFK